MSEKSEWRRIFDVACEMGNLPLLERIEADVRSGSMTLSELGLTEAELRLSLYDCRTNEAARLFFEAKDGCDFACLAQCELIMTAAGLAPDDISSDPVEFAGVRRDCYAASARFFYGLAQPHWTDWFRRGRRLEERAMMFQTACERLKEGGLRLEDIGVDQAEYDRFMRTLVR